MMNLVKLLAPLCLAQVSLLSSVFGCVRNPLCVTASAWYKYKCKCQRFLESFYEGQDFCVSVNNARVNDPRDVNSLYANTRNSCQRRTIFNFVPTDGGYFLQAADIRTAAGPEANGWFLGVHDFYESDNAAPNDLRVIFHRVATKAAVWDFVLRDGEPVLEVTRNLDPTGIATIGCYMAVTQSPERTTQSFYLSVTEDIHNAVVVTPVPDTPMIE